MAETTRRRVPEPPTFRTDSGLGPVLNRNILALTEHRRALEARAGPSERIAEAITRFTGSMTFVVLHLVAVAGWVSVNLGIVPGVPRRELAGHVAPEKVLDELAARDADLEG